MQRLLWVSSALLVAACASSEDLEGDAPDGGAGASGSAGSGASGGTGGAGGAGASGGAGGSTGGTGSTGGAGGASGGAGGTTGGTGGVCVPGIQIQCACPGGALGVQICNASGTGYEACDCPAGTGGAGGSGGSTGGSGGSTGGSGGSTGGSGGSTGGSGGSTGGSGGSGATGGNGADACPGSVLVHTPPVTHADGTTAGQSNDWSGGTRCGPSGGGNDVVYQFTSTVTGNATVQVTPSGFSACVYVSAGTCDGDNPSKGAYSVNIGQVVQLVFPVTQGTTYHVFVDSYSTGTTGTFTFTLSFS